jgi:hypothetical protein
MGFGQVTEGLFRHGIGNAKPLLMAENAAPVVTLQVSNHLHNTFCSVILYRSPVYQRDFQNPIGNALVNGVKAACSRVHCSTSWHLRRARIISDKLLSNKSYNPAKYIGQIEYLSDSAPKVMMLEARGSEEPNCQLQRQIECIDRHFEFSVV